MRTTIHLARLAALLVGLSCAGFFGCDEGSSSPEGTGHGGSSGDDSSGPGGALSGLDEGNDIPLPDLPAVTPVTETSPVKGFGDAADDPAIWVHPTDPEKSLIFATDKTTTGGLFVYALDGTELDFLPLGELNNVDLRSGFELDEKTVTLITATNRTDDTLVILALDHETLKLRDVAQSKVETIFDSYGLCMYKSPSGKFYSFVNGTEGDVLQFELTADGDRVSAELVRQFCVESQPEGCVVDDAEQRLFLGEEAFGVWVFPAEETAPSTGDETPACEQGVAGHLLASTLNGDLARDVEGMALAAVDDGGYLIVSAQGEHEYVLFDRHPPYDKVMSFAVWGGGEACVDGTEETDGLDVTTANLGGNYQQGLLVVQDGFNGDPVNKQNFKLVSLGDVLSFVEDKNQPFEPNSACNLGDYGGKPKFANLPPGPELTEEFCQNFCAKCADCYEQGDPGFSEGDCHYKSGKPHFLENDCLEGCALGVNPADTRPLSAGWQAWECLDLDDAL